MKYIFLNIYIYITVNDYKVIIFKHLSNVLIIKKVILMLMIDILITQVNTVNH